MGVNGRPSPRPRTFEEKTVPKQRLIGGERFEHGPPRGPSTGLRMLSVKTYLQTVAALGACCVVLTGCAAKEPGVSAQPGPVGSGGPSDAGADAPAFVPTCMADNEF